MAPLSARAGDAGGDAESDAKGSPADAKSSTEDAKSSNGDASERDATPDVVLRADGPTGCIGEGEPCTSSERCCQSEAYCGAFGGVGASYVCGLNSSNSLSTGSCSMTSRASGEGIWVDALLSASVLAVTMGFLKRRARRD